MDCSATWITSSSFLVSHILTLSALLNYAEILETFLATNNLARILACDGEDMREYEQL